MPKGRLVFDGDNIYTEKDARIYKLKSSVSSKIDAIPWVVDSLDSASTTDALSANMGRQLQDQINSLSWTWKFLSTWNAATWLPGTNPQEDPYTYKAWDYYVVSTIGSTNYKPHWGTYTQWVPSTTVELENVWTNDKYYFDWANWVRIPDTAIQIWIDSALSTTSTNAVENRAIANAINIKQNTIPDLNDIRSWAAAWATALQPNANISQLTNNVGYQTAWDVASAIAWKQDVLSAWDWISLANNVVTNTKPGTAVSSTAPSNPQEWDLWYDTVNHVLKIYNWTNWETVDTDSDTTYTAWNGINISAQNIISVDTSVVATQNDLVWKADISDIPTTVAELSDAADYATKIYADNAASSVVSDTAFSNAWDGDTTHAPSKNAVYDEINSIEWDISTIQWDITNLGTDKQDTLVSGTNIKTINNESLLWSGNIDLSSIITTASTFWEFINACKAYGTRHESATSVTMNYTFQWIWYISIDLFYNCIVKINWETVVDVNYSSWDRMWFWPITFWPWDTIVSVKRDGWHAGHFDWFLADYY